MDPIYNEKYTEYQSKRGMFRSLIRSIYMSKAASLADGPTIDFGCGIGDLLTRLPDGSCGLEYNPHTVDVARRRGLNVALYDGKLDDWQMSALPENIKFQTMVISHVLEHFENPFEIFTKLINSAEKCSVRRLVIIVPGLAGYKIDDSHRQFIQANDFKRFFECLPTWQIKSMQFYPINVKKISELFTHNELQLVAIRP